MSLEQALRILRTGLAKNPASIERHADHAELKAKISPLLGTE